MARTEFRVTYATMSAEDESLHTGYDAGIEGARTALGQSHPFVVDGRRRWGEGVAVERSPIDGDIVVGEFAQGTRDDVDAAVAAARAFAPAWAATPWPERVAALRRASDLISEGRHLLAATMAFEVGKNRLEALADVEESADLIRYCCQEMERHGGFHTPMNRPNGESLDVMRPYGVWAVISPFNFPMAQAAGPAGAALVAGNTVVLKPSSAGALCALLLARVFADAGIPPGAFHVVTGAGSVVGAALIGHPGVDGVTFAGSYEVGMGIYRSFPADYPKPAICQMGGKNPVIVTGSADLDEAAEGTMHSAFGFGGQKCSAASRAYVARRAYDGFLQRLVIKMAGIRVGNPLERDVYLGPVIDEAAVGRYQKAVAEAGSRGLVLTGGERLSSGDLARGTYVLPTVVEVPGDSWIWRRELLVPLLAVAPVDSLEEALARANDTPFGLTAGFYGRDPEEVDHFLEGIHAGVVYVNHRAGATTGAWPAVQPFGGWKGSGTGGKSAGGPYYLPQYLREQSRTIVRD